MGRIDEQAAWRLGDCLPAGTGVCIINLEERCDRWEAVQGEVLYPHFTGLPCHRIAAVSGSAISGFGHPPYFRNRVKDLRWANRGGCVLSHRSAVQHAMEKNWPFALILEDDIHLPHILTETSAKAVKHDLKDEGWDVCYFGYTDPKGPFRPWGTGNAHQAFYEVFGCNCGHAYLLNRKAMATILKLLPIEHDIWPWLARHRAVDRFYYRNLAPSLKVIALSSSLIEQKPGQSDILNRPTEQQALHYRVKIDSDQASPRLNYRCLLYARKWAFKLQGVLDCVRGWWKKKRGF